MSAFVSGARINCSRMGASILCPFHERMSDEKAGVGVDLQLGQYKLERPQDPIAHPAEHIDVVKHFGFVTVEGDYLIDAGSFPFFVCSFSLSIIEKLPARYLLLETEYRSTQRTVLLSFPNGLRHATFLDLKSAIARRLVGNARQILVGEEEE